MPRNNAKRWTIISVIIFVIGIAMIIGGIVLDDYDFYWMIFVGAILALTSLDFLGLGVPPSTPSLGELLAQGKANIEAWWLSLSTFVVLVGTLVLLIFIGEALREAFDPRK